MIEQKSRGILELIGRQKGPTIIALSLALIGAIGVAEYLIGIGFSFSFFDIIPIFLIAGVAELWFIAGAALLCTGAWILAAILQGWRYPHLYMFYWNGFIRFGILLAVGYLTHQLREALRYQVRQSHTDYLTGTANGRLFYERLQAEIDRSRRYTRPFSLAYIDVDDFKSVNDLHGHEGGDLVLRAIASLLLSNVRKADVVGRLGGDEFALLLVECDEREASAVIEKIQANLKAKLSQFGWAVTLSIGVITTHEAIGDQADILKAADELMYRAKKGGKDNALFSTPLIPHPGKKPEPGGGESEGPAR